MGTGISRKSGKNHRANFETGPLIIIIIVIIIIIIIIQTISKSFRKYVSDIPEYMTLGSYRKQPYWALHTYFGKC